MLSAAPTFFLKNLYLFCKQNNHLTRANGLYRWPERP